MRLQPFASRLAVIVATALPLLAEACPQEPAGPLPVGTWGGDNAGVVVSDTTMHVHIGCTVGDAPRPSTSDGRFEIAGRYNITAHPVDLGVFHPAIFSGRVNGGTMTLTVRLTDTTVTIGPAVVELGREPKMGPCPICRTLTPVRSLTLTPVPSPLRGEGNARFLPTGV